jgi:hypothetical protein
MTRKRPETNPANRKISRPTDVRERHAADQTAATRLSLPKARLGGELAGERSDGNSETAEALKRAAENERRS